MPGEGHHAMYRLFYTKMLLEVLLDPLALLSVKRS